VIYTNNIAAVYLLAGRPSYCSLGTPEYNPDLAASGGRAHAQLVGAAGPGAFRRRTASGGWNVDAFEQVSPAQMA
jgi:hypothetical protein